MRQNASVAASNAGAQSRIKKPFATGAIVYLEGQEDLASRLITTITHAVTLVVPILNLATKSQ